MLGIILSEMDFDYELQMLVKSFFPGQECLVTVDPGKVPELEVALVLALGREEIRAQVLAGAYAKEEVISADGERDWHKNPDKSGHPYRAWYKNELKRMVFRLLEGVPESAIAGMFRRVPEWGTMTGVRPAKISMRELLQGKPAEQVEAELREVYCCHPDKVRLCMEVAKKEADLLGDVDCSRGYSLYIGIPFCPTTCLYCSFPSYPYEKFGKLSGEYLEALLRELEAVGQECAGHPLTAIYVGGGTPTALAADQLDFLLAQVERHFPVEECREWTVEAGRPDSITEEKLRVLRRHGISRISINPQTMQEETLGYIGRKHSVGDVVTAVKMARGLGFDNINMDLIAGLPGERVSHFEDTLEQVRRLDPDSITVHSLVVKRASKLREMLERGEDSEGREAARREQMDLMVRRALSFGKEHGYAPYYMYRQKNSSGQFGTSSQENIGFARPGKESLYNVLMMEEMQTIAAVGAGASTKHYHVSGQMVSRIENVKSITDYIGRIDEMIARKQGRIW